MKPILSPTGGAKARPVRGFTIVELITAMAVTLSVFAGGLVGIVVLNKSFAGFRQYAAGSNDGNRVSDYVSRDLRSALGVSRIDSGTTTLFKSGSLEVNGTSQLVVFVPDYYSSNVPDNTSGSAYKTAHFSRANLPSGTTYFSYDSTVVVVGTTRVPKYPGQLEVRYLKKARSAQDPTLCYFRQEYDGGATPTLRSQMEIAEKVEMEKLTVVATNQRQFSIITSFSPRWSGEAKRAGTVQFSAVSLLNPRRD